MGNELVSLIQIYIHNLNDFHFPVKLLYGKNLHMNQSRQFMNTTGIISHKASNHYQNMLHLSNKNIFSHWWLNIEFSRKTGEQSVNSERNC